MAQIPFRQGVHSVAVQTCVHCVGHQHRVINRGDGDPQLGKDFRVVLHVLPNLENTVILQNGLEHLKTASNRHLAGCKVVRPKEIV